MGPNVSNTTINIVDVPTVPLQKSDFSVTPVPLGGEHLVLITPSDEEERLASAMENWFQSSASDEPFSLELAGTKREQGFVLRASSQDQLVLLCKQFAAQYPQAEIQRIAPSADPLVLRPGEHAVIGEFAMIRKPYLPLKTFSGKTLTEPGADPLAGILAAMEPLGSGQRLVSQLALVRAPENWIERYLRKSVEHPLQGERDAISKSAQPTSNTTEGIKTALLIGGLFGAILGYHWYRVHAWLWLTLLILGILVAGIGLLWWWIKQSRKEIYDMKLVGEKLSRASFYTHLRVIVIGQQNTSTEQQLRAHLMRMEVAYRQFSLASANGLALKRIYTLTPEQKQARQLPSAEHAFPYHHLLRRWLHSGAPTSDVWNGLELSGAFHLPQATTDLPLVRRISVKHLLASPEIARQIEQAKAPLPPALVGYSQHRGYKIPVYMPFSTLFSHKFLVARSRYGKSTLIQLLVHAAMHPVQDRTLQPGIFVIDPHKDLIEDLLSLVPANRTQDVVLLDLTDTQHVVSLNPLDASMGFSRDQAVANLMSSFERVWADFWGPRMSYFLKSVCLLLYTLNEGLVREGKAEEQFTLLDINPLLQYSEYAMQVLSMLDMSETWHQELFSWWQNVYFSMPKQFRSEVIMPIVSKLGIFNDNHLLRRIVGQPVTRAPIHLAVTEGKIVLCALSARDMDDASVNVLGSTLINLLHRAFGMQQNVPLQQRRKVFCAADEFHAFSGGDFDRLLSEDAKFGCSLLLATQTLKRLNKIRDGLMEMVFSNCENVYAFNTSAADAKILEDELRGIVEQKHIISQPRLHCYARLAIPDYPLQIVSVTLATPPSWQRSTARLRRAAEIRQQNQRLNAVAGDIDRRYTEHLKQYLDVGPFAQKLQRENRAKQVNKQLQEHARQLTEEGQNGKQHRDLIQDEEVENRSSSTPPTQLRVSSLEPSTAPPVQQSTDDQKEENKENGSPLGVNNSNGAAQQGNSTSENEKTSGRNHSRSKRKKSTKNPVGIPPPPPSDTSDDQNQNDAPRPRTFGTGRDSFWGRERERGQ